MIARKVRSSFLALLFLALLALPIAAPQAWAAGGLAAEDGSSLVAQTDTVAEGTVLDQDIVANQTVPQGTTITLTVSTGPKMVKIPDVSGNTYEEAEAALTALGFKCSKSFRQNDGTHPANTVAETSPLKDSEVKEGSLVMIVLWKDVETTVPVIDIGQQAQTTVPATTRPAPTRPSTTEPAVTEEPYEYPTFEVTEYVETETLN